MSLSPTVALSVLRDLITAATQYNICKEQERTKRLKIEADLEACLELINKNHEIFLRVMDDNQSLAMRTYDAAEKLLENPEVYTDPTKLQAVLTFLRDTNTTHGNSLIAVANAHSLSRLPRIG